ncbi:hypothetical protein M9H77_31283 [Catharanthus roseus]|uniref:Uncharacterized protein n=1 Tax=Catharanthus roseus TaxID=4058 RepID=A0ACC0A0K6_CATRO|nr:hypothetical protein M9H77_31283 [Catharanthus roseus]
MANRGKGRGERGSQGNMLEVQRIIEQLSREESNKDAMVFIGIDRGKDSALYTANKGNQVRTNTASSLRRFNSSEKGHGYYSCPTRQINLAKVDEEDVYHDEPTYDQYDDESEKQEIYVMRSQDRNSKRPSNLRKFCAPSLVLKKP